MAVDTQISQVNYEGNGSTSVGYPITFPFLDPDHILVGTLNEDDEITLLDSDDYTVDVDESEVFTNPAIADTETVVILRSMPLTQPTVYPEGGAFPSREHERALDRLTMLVQQIARLVDGTGVNFGGDLSDIITLANAAARNAATPRRIGQVAIQLNDDSLWYGSNIGVGQWTRLAARKYLWARDVWSRAETVTAVTRYAGHIHVGGTVHAIRLSHNVFNSSRNATINIKKNGSDLLSVDEAIFSESLLLEGGWISPGTLAPGDRIDIEVVSIGSGAGDPPQGLQIEIELHEN
jgi:hypothetical protein